MMLSRNSAHFANGRPDSWTVLDISHRSQNKCTRGTLNELRATRVFQTDAGSWVVAPAKGSQPSKGIIHFLGGAFAGAAPQIVYSLLLEILANDGYTVVSTPYAITFRHLDCALAVKRQFVDSVEELRLSPSQADLVPSSALCLGVGHSMGSLLHLLIGSTNSDLPPTVANALMSYNNKQVSDAIPVPGLLDALAPAVQAARTLPPNTFFGTPPKPSELLSTAASWLPPSLREVVDEGGRLTRAGLALEQLGTVVGEVGDGTTAFDPSPAEARRMISRSYAVQKTMLVRFSDDGIDETPEVETLLRGRFPGTGVQALLLPGTHLTPCGGDIKLDLPPATAGGAVGAFSELLRVQAQVDVRRLGDRLVGFLNAQCAATIR
ncbi:hypothetical protein CEUSTIGMA_g6580.t1 [Chlamydomonas eustigma]|uniref:AB hydrolase-1 domain-containing protein n=1 Tax=Chlamydomonas eustigma TaxID=1157962 RepID=A0A250X8P0_9CHLO|nr:hypothetical protein CEUSTIGMA_g6580.t1 [Chlamydomonas eustigma]|eukprot:GAX79140.1 hypothetical protein CEUSTIGMA_g6580.t1 [Chlamydomonas eustigma]